MRRFFFGFSTRRDVTIRNQRGKNDLPVKSGRRINESIDVEFVQLIQADGINLGKTAISVALETASTQGLDLVEFSPGAEVPVCKIMDHGKFKFQEQKRAATARKRQRKIDVKEVKLRPNIDTHDFDVKLRSIRRFLEDGDKIKITVRFRGREMAHQDLGVKLLDRLRSCLEGEAKVEQAARIEGRQMLMVISPV